MKYNISEVITALGIKPEKTIQESVVSILLTDSRKLSFPEETLFFALLTKTDDGHNYINDLYIQGVRNFVVSSNYRISDEHINSNFLIVKDPLHALQKLVTHHRRKFDIPVIGITGSNGKTVVKEWLYQLDRKSVV